MTMKFTLTLHTPSRQALRSPDLAEQGGRDGRREREREDDRDMSRSPFRFHFPQGKGVLTLGILVFLVITIFPPAWVNHLGSDSNTKASTGSVKRMNGVLRARPTRVIRSVKIATENEHQRGRHRVVA
ncbi:hypothetical protein EDB89DRAFT_1909672 [Lactarius sanguifluus]|nr:hypothetical protein EDB89DRAFT_1909672 [Lactarius sanguifluus]